MFKGENKVKSYFVGFAQKDNIVLHIIYNTSVYIHLAKLVDQII